mmetsp:Transcript_24892/g.34306  ORF Transcript_24892/g.34306 Transcript_24892/m.34306 type:complete len:213 (+) Transcript_24892:148-786(+)|eukprot:CAMPEP_0196571144 /NCGR_PEP_ID=MMETSP1081-20130531/1310_1 /TAXON_ID=36882 /ORGANISM="Pyramimonas amylifera, Strain CCMP720" /LENGTH=212 /DNA_ID=CAMNT_0041887953 /DNA_START=148 /DNA_END=786 /DNA_ORIENTATION=+
MVNSFIQYAAMVEAPLRPSILFGVVLVFINVIGKIGEIFAPIIAVDRPLLLILLNANDVHLALTSTTTDVASFFVVAGIRRCLEDPIYFFAGHYYGDAALGWLKQNLKIGAELLEGYTPWFNWGAPACIMFFPNAAVGVLAGASRMPARTFLSYTALGVFIRLVAIRFVGQMASVYVGQALSLLEDYQAICTTITLVLGVTGTWSYVKWYRG